ncbi:HAD family hydrolase [Acutalibacter sp. 1XD8-33]|uniref:HAD family hydrolase n=1 Tax=Acutalibacter sp. 1XD8-33 TaxID=2320081 RepID=UPI000EA3C193|nr:HAD family hydrolase [Acutalibacter sp. 1XD8-33]RKJ40934.1 HAD family hydrolase [Acutalibacter sp. 1XD8-33]
MLSSDLRSIPKPEMVLFDYGDTLAWEPIPDFLRGWRTVFQFVREKPADVGPEQAQALADSLWRRFSHSRSLSASKKGGFEIHEWHQLRTVSEALGLEFSLSLPEVETVLMDSSCPSHPHPGTAEMLDFLRTQGIPTGVISNIGWSGQALAHRLTKLFPAHQFQFVLASSEYGIRKPDPLLFQIALRKAGLPPEKVWYCGDNWEADVEGAHRAGLFPVWMGGGGAPPGGGDFPYLKISAWRELADALEELSEITEKKVPCI